MTHTTRSQEITIDAVCNRTGATRVMPSHSGGVIVEGISDDVVRERHWIHPNGTDRPCTVEELEQAETVQRYISINGTAPPIIVGTERPECVRVLGLDQHELAVLQMAIADVAREMHDTRRRAAYAEHTRYQPSDLKHIVEALQAKAGMA